MSTNNDLAAQSACVDHGKKGNGFGYDRRPYRGRRLVLVHRLIYCQYNGLEVEDIKGLMVRHTCDNPRCINASHLVIGTHTDNMRDMAVRRRVWNVRLTADQVAFIRSYCKPNEAGNSRSNPYGFSAVARRLGVSCEAVRSAYQRRSFVYLP